MELISSDFKFDFIGKSKFAIFLSLICLGLSIFIWIDTGPAKYGIDFKGGHEVILSFSKEVGSEAIRKALEKDGKFDPVVQAFEVEEGEYKYSVRLSGNKDQSTAVKEELSAALDAGLKEKYTIAKTNFVGPTIGSELRKKALTAVILGLIAILAYITYRFEFAFALGAVAALFHDVIICIGIYLFFGKTLNMASLAAALTIVGYSVNDTIIVFDRMREEMFKQKNLGLKDLMNFSIAATLSRTVITSLLTLFSALALLIFGGGSIADLSLFLVVGVISGTYSTVFIAAPVALAWEYFRRPEPKS